MGHLSQPVSLSRRPSISAWQRYDQEMIRPDCVIARAKRVGINECGRSHDDVDAFASQRLGSRWLVDLLNLALDIRSDICHPNVARTIRDPEPLRRANLMGGFRRSNQRFARHASRPGAIAADAIALDEGHSCAEPRGKP